MKVVPGIILLVFTMVNALCIAQVSYAASGLESERQTKMDKKSSAKLQVIYNLDETEYFVGTFGPVTPDTIDKFVDEHAALGVTDLFININSQRTDFRSNSWEAYWDGYDPKLAKDQPFFAGIDPADGSTSEMIINMYKLYKMGCDYPQRMIDRARKKRMKPWLSIRMNDSHYPEWPDHPYHSTIWKSHPEWRLPAGLDWEQSEVREHYMKLIKEVCFRYNVDGIELDYLRFWLYFRPGREREGAKLMTAFVEQVREVTKEAAKKWHHPVKLAVRVPSSPWISRMHGLEAVDWAKAGLVDFVIVSSFWPSINSDMPIESWKGMLIGSKVKIAVGLEGCIDGGSGLRNSTPDEQRGAMLSGLQRGADMVYFFNLFTNPYHYWPREDYNRVVLDAGSYSTLCSEPRRHSITITRPWAAGEPGSPNLLPYTGINGAFRIHIGPKPEAQQKTSVELIVKDSDQPLDIRVNGTQCQFSGSVEPEHIKRTGMSGQPKRQVYAVPMEAINEGYNLIEVNAKEVVTITWVEISVK